MISLVWQSVCFTTLFFLPLPAAGLGYYLFKFIFPSFSYMGRHCRGFAFVLCLHSVLHYSQKLQFLFADSATSLIAELRFCFPQHEILDAHGIVYPQYWATPNAEENFRKHLHLLKGFYGELKMIVEGDKSPSVAPLLDTWQLDTQQAYFKLAMLNNHKQAM
jgi:hypothetical protein